MAHSIRASTIVARVARETHESIERLYPEQVLEGAPSTDELPASAPARVLENCTDAGVVIDVDTDALMERTPQKDAAFGFRQLVDIAVRALSPGVNDPTTAVEALDRLHDLLRSLVQRDISSAVRIAATLQELGPKRAEQHTLSKHSLLRACRCELQLGASLGRSRVGADVDEPDPFALGASE